MEKQKLVPELRFTEFEGEWKKKKFGEIAKFSKGKGISKIDISMDGEIECIRYGELYTRYGEVISEVHSKTNIDKKDLVLSEANDVIIPASGETQIDIATASCVLRTGIALGGDLNVIRTNNNGVFLSYYLNNRKKLDIANLAQGISVVHLYSSQLAVLNLNLPQLPEQQKIASFLTAVDGKLTQLKKKKRLLEQYKKGVMQKIFSQELRFKDEDGNKFPKWEKKKLGEIADIITGNKDTQNKVDTGKYPFFVRSQNVERIDSFSYDGEAILTSGDGVGVGKNFHYINGKFDFHQRVYCLNNFKNQIEGKFVFYYFSENFNKRIMRMSAKNSVDSIRRDMIFDMLIDLPSLSEQTKIANFLSAIDEKINHTQIQIEKTEQWKKGLLQKMFV